MIKFSEFDEKKVICNLMYTGFYLSYSNIGWQILIHTILLVHKKNKFQYRFTHFHAMYPIFVKNRIEFFQACNTLKISWDLSHESPHERDIFVVYQTYPWLVAPADRARFCFNLTLQKYQIFIKNKIFIFFIFFWVFPLSLVPVLGLAYHNSSAIWQYCIYWLFDQCND